MAYFEFMVLPIIIAMALPSDHNHVLWLQLPLYHHHQLYPPLMVSHQSLALVGELPMSGF